MKKKTLPTRPLKDVLHEIDQLTGAVDAVLGYAVRIKTDDGNELTLTWGKLNKKLLP